MFLLLQVHTDLCGKIWKPVFVAVTNIDMLLYDFVPITKEDWASPVQSYPILATRYRSFYDLDISVSVKFIK